MNFSYNLKAYKEAFKGLTNFFNKKGEKVNEEDYPLSTGIAKISVKDGYYDVVLDV